MDVWIITQEWPGSDSEEEAGGSLCGVYTTRDIAMKMFDEQIADGEWHCLTETRPEGNPDMWKLRSSHGGIYQLVLEEVQES
jgi:hypothetical protein